MQYVSLESLNYLRKAHTYHLLFSSFPPSSSIGTLRRTSTSSRKLCWQKA